MRVTTFQNCDKLAKVWKLHTSPYHLQTNGQYERFNHILIGILDTLPKIEKSNWRDTVPMLVHSYDCFRSKATEFSPHYLMYDQKPRLPVNLNFGTQNTDIIATTGTKFGHKLHERLKWAYKIAQHVIEKEN